MRPSRLAASDGPLPAHGPLLFQQRGLLLGIERGCVSKCVNHALRRLRHEVETAGVKSLAMPKLATGAGGLSWDVVRPLIDQHLGDLPIPVFVYTTYHKGQQAVQRGA